MNIEQYEHEFFHYSRKVFLDISYIRDNNVEFRIQIRPDPGVLVRPGSGFIKRTASVLKHGLNQICNSGARVEITEVK